MITRTLSTENYEILRNHLMKKAHIEPMDVGYTVDMTIDGVNYTLKLMLEKHWQVAILQVWPHRSQPQRARGCSHYGRRAADRLPRNPHLSGGALILQPQRLS